MQLTYNGVELGGYLITRSIDQGPVYDPSKSDKLYDRIRIQVQAVVNPAFAPALPAESPAATMARVRHLLTAPRRPLVLADNGTTYVNLPGGLDDANGPLPDESCIQITELAPAAWLVSFAVTVHLTDCGSTPPAYLSNRWEESTTTDRDWYTVKRRTGTLIVSSRGANSPDDLRALVSPPVDDGFRRESAEYRRSADGLRMSYTFVDRQLAKMPPIPGTKLTGTMVQTSTHNGGKRNGEIRLTLSAPPKVDPRDMMNALIRVGIGRVRQSNPQLTPGDNKLFFQDAAITENLDDERNDVSLHLRWQMKPVGGGRIDGQQLSTGAQVVQGFGGAAVGGVIGGLLGGPLGFVLGSGLGAAAGTGVLSPEKTPEGKDTGAVAAYAGWVGKPLAGTEGISAVAPPTRGWDLAAAVRLTAAALRDPCGQEVELRGGAEPNTLVGTTGGATLRATDSTSDTPGDDQALYADDGPGVWDSYHVTCHYVDDTGERFLPPAKADGPVKVVRVHGRMLSARVEWALTRIGGEPGAPAIPLVYDPNWRYLHGTISLENLDVAGDGVSIRYEACGVWEFVCLDPSKAALRYPIPSFLSPALVAAASGFGRAAGAAVSTLTAGGAAADAGAAATLPTSPNDPPSFIPFGVPGGAGGPAAAGP